MKHTQEIQQALDMLKEEIAAELGIEYGAEATSGMNGKLGGQITKKLIHLGEIKLVEMMNEKNSVNNVVGNQYMYQVNNHNVKQDQLH